MKGGHNDMPSGPPPTEPPPAMQPMQPEPFHSHVEIEKQVFGKLEDILFKHHREMGNLPKLGGQSALMGEAVSEKEILTVMQDASNKFFTEMLARTFAPRGHMESW